MGRYACGTNMIYYALIPLFKGINVCHKWILKAMLNRKKLNVRIAPDLYRHLKENAPTTMTDYVETLLMNGLMSDISDIYKDAQDRYENLIALARNDELKSKEAEIADLKLKIKNSNSYLETEVNLMVNMCISEGVPREKIEKYAQDFDEEDELATKLKFINRLTVELARARDYEGDTIRGWVQKIKK